MSCESESIRITITLKPNILKELDRLAKEWGTSRSGMVTNLTQLQIKHEAE